MEHNRRKSIFDTMSAIKKIRKEDEEKKHKEDEIEEELEFQKYYENWKKNLLDLQVIEMRILAIKRYKREIKEQDHSKSENKNNLTIY